MAIIALRSGPALGRLGRSDSIRPRAYGGGSCISNFKEITHCDTTQSSWTDFVTYVNISKRQFFIFALHKNI
jgi:hypothetical protein